MEVFAAYEQRNWIPEISQIVQSESEDSEEELEILHSNNGGRNCSVMPQSTIDNMDFYAMQACNLLR